MNIQRENKGCCKNAKIKGTAIKKERKKKQIKQRKREIIFDVEEKGSKKCLWCD